jgi:hypothetical protein
MVEYGPRSGSTEADHWPHITKVEGLSLAFVVETGRERKNRGKICKA